MDRTTETTILENQTENKMKHEMESSVDYRDSFLEDVIIVIIHIFTVTFITLSTIYFSYNYIGIITEYY